MSKQILVVGAGFAGAVVARELAVAGYKVHVIDKRPHIAGNCYDFINEHGIRVHKYGPHIFHTNNKDVVDWLSQFTKWTDYTHKVKAKLEPDLGFSKEYVPLPINAETRSVVSEDKLVDTFIRPYTEKMWGVKLEELDPSILYRIPMRHDYNDSYFDDRYQGFPKEGYTKLFENILNHENITVELNRPYNHIQDNLGYDYIFNSMPIDEYFDYCHGPLPYRSIKFRNANFNKSDVDQPTSVVNFTNTGPYTRVTEWSKFPGHGGNSSKMTTLTFEEPCDYLDNDKERYYPVKDIHGHNREIYEKYKLLVDQRKMQFIGRCGLYAYLDMHQAISSSLAVARKFISS